MKVKINDGYIGNHPDGSVAQPGEIVEVENSEGAIWIASGVASKVKAVTKSKNKAVLGSANKAEG